MSDVNRLKLSHLQLLQTLFYGGTEGPDLYLSAGERVDQCHILRVMVALSHMRVGMNPDFALVGRQSKSQTGFAACPSKGLSPRSGAENGHPGIGQASTHCCSGWPESRVGEPPQEGPSSAGTFPWSDRRCSQPGQWREQGRGGQQSPKAGGRHYQLLPMLLGTHHIVDIIS